MSKIRWRFALLGASALTFILVQLWGFGAIASTNDPQPSEIYITGRT